MNEIPNETVMKAAAGDMEAFEEIYRATSGFVYNIALRMANNTGDADEITQDVFIKVHKNLRDFGFRSAFRTWVYRVAVNTAINYCKRRSKNGWGRVEYDPAIHDAGTPPEQKKGLEKEEVRRRVGLLLECLDSDQRACIILREIEGLNYREIAETLGININTVRSRLKRGREKIIAAMKKG